MPKTAMDKFNIIRHHLFDAVPLTEIVDSTTVSLRTLKRWVQQYKSNGLTGLQPKQRSDKGIHYSIDAKLIAIAEALALKKPPITLAAIHRQVAQIAKRDQLPVPSYRVIRDVVKSLDPGLMKLAHEGSKAYNESYELIYRICYGLPGVGKTLSAKYYARQDQLMAFDRSEKADENLTKQIAANQTLFYTAPVSTTPKQLDKAINDERISVFLSKFAAQRSIGEEDKIDHDGDALLIVDEADRLNVKSLEQVRDIYDRYGNWGVILIGMPGFERRLSRYAQLYSRIGFAHKYLPVSEEELLFILKHHWEKLGLQLDKQDFSDSEAIAAISRTTNGNFRLIHRLFSQIERIMKVNQLKSITKEVVQAARDCLVIGKV